MPFVLTITYLSIYLFLQMSVKAQVQYNSKYSKFTVKELNSTENNNLSMIILLINNIKDFKDSEF